MEPNTQTPITVPSTSPQSAEPATSPDQSQDFNLGSWPGAFGIYKTSRQAVLRSLSTLVLIALISALISQLIGLFDPSHNGALATIYGVKVPLLNVQWIAVELVSILVSIFFKAAGYYTFITSVRGRRVSLGEALKTALKYVLKLVLLDLLLGLTAAASFIVFIIPTFIVMPRLALAPYFLVGQDLGIIEAYKASWHATKGHVGKVWGIIGAIIVMLLPILTIIGIIATIYLLFMYGAAFAVLYQFVISRPTLAPSPGTLGDVPPATDIAAPTAS